MLAAVSMPTVPWLIYIACLKRLKLQLTVWWSVLYDSSDCILKIVAKTNRLKEKKLSAPYCPLSAIRLSCWWVLTLMSKIYIWCNIAQKQSGDATTSVLTCHIILILAQPAGNKSIWLITESKAFWGKMFYWLRFIAPFRLREKRSDLIVWSIAQ